MRLLITAAIVLFFSIPAQAAHRHRHHHHAYSSHHRVAAQFSRGWRRHGSARRRHYAAQASRGGGGMVTVSTAAGPITVARNLAGRFQALIADFVANGYKPQRVSCLAHGGHVPHSRHYAGAACDFDQRGWGKTVGFMYKAQAIIARHGLRDGCSFSDCGHVDDGKPVRYAQRWRGGRFGG